MAAFPQITIQHSIGNTIDIPNQLDVKVNTYISNNLAAGVTAIPVDNTTDFTTPAPTTLLLLSSMGAENAEIVTASAKTTLGFTTGATLMIHNRGDSVSELNYDQVVVSFSATINGAYVVLNTSTFQVTQQTTRLFHAAGLTTSFYKLQWKNSLTGNLSDYSDPISVSTYETTAVASIIYPVLRAMGVSENDPKITTEFLIGAVDDARKYTESKLYGIRHAWQQNFEYPIKVLAGNNSVALPDDIDFDETDRSMLAARFLIGNVLTPYNLRYIDKRSWNQIAFSVMGGYTTADVNIGDVIIPLDSVGDFPNTSGGNAAAYVATTAFSQTILQIGYLGVDLTANTLTGVTGVTRNIPSGTRIWARPTISQPIYYTIYEDKLVFDRILPDSMQGNNVYIDYYKKKIGRAHV